MKLKDMEKIADFTNHRYVIRMMEPSDWLRHYNEGGEVVNDFILPRGPREQDEFSDTIYHAGTEVPYHWHENGWETFEVANGSVDCVVNGVHFILQKGDLLHLPPYTAHGFTFLEEDTIWRELFQSMNMSGGIFEKNMVNNNYPERRENEEFMRMYRPKKLEPRQRPAAWDDPLTDHSEVFQVRTPDFAWTAHEGNGYSLKLKISKSETGGCKEIWHADLKKGLRAEFAYPHMGYDLYYIQKGRLELTVDATHEHKAPQKFIVEGDSIIDIPPCTTYSIMVLEDTALYDYGGAADLQACLEDLRRIRLDQPELFENDDEFRAFLRRFKVYCTALSMEG
ncbi:MAG: cupin domain-containing protein [Firmicutes bacterium]|nr:cupin domain-containing protein [Bacillota bacterium]